MNQKDQEIKDKLQKLFTALRNEDYKFILDQNEEKERNPVVYSTIVSLKEIATKLNNKIDLLGEYVALEREKDEAYLRYLNLHKGAPFGIISIDEQGIIKETNEASLKLFGYGEKELIGQPIDILLPLYLRKAHQKHIASFFTKPSMRRMGENRELVCERKDGSTFLCDIVLSFYTEKGENYGVAYIHDITERKEKEREIKKIATFPEQNPHPIYRISKENKLIYSNPAGKELMGDLTLNNQKDTIDQFYDFSKQALQTSTRLSMEIDLKDKAYILEFLPDKQNGYINIYGSDISGYKEAEKLRIEKAAAVKSIRFKDDFLANMSHEIRTPMNGIIGMVNILSNNTKLDSEQHKFVEIIKDSSHSLLEILNDILDLSKLEAGQMQITKKSFDIVQLVDRNINLFSARCSEKKLKLKSEYDELIVRNIISDEGRVGQVISNFVGNAIKFTEKGSVTVKLSLDKKNEKKIRVEVIDTGEGIAKENQEKLFSRYQQLEETRNNQIKGTGLGLSICAKIIEILGGEIGVESELGKGSNFWFTFPFEVVEHEESNIATTNESGKKNKSKFELNVLLVDDKKVNLIVAGQMLKSIGCSITTAINGANAIEKFKADKFDLVLMDIQMPFMNGIAATKIIKRDYEEVPPIVGLSANAMEGDAEKYINEGMDDYLTKPLTIEALLTTMNKFFAQ